MAEKSNKVLPFPQRGFGEFYDPARLLRRQGAVYVFIGIFVVLAFGADIKWPSRKSYFATYTETFKNFTVLHPVMPPCLITPGGAGLENYSTPYMALLRLVYHYLIPHRLAAMRAVSVLCAALTLYFLARIVAKLFSPTVASLLIFLLATSPIYVESMRAFGYQAMSHLAAIMVIYFAVRSLEKPVAAAWAGCFSALTLSLYVTSRTAAVIPILFLAVNLRRCWKSLLIYITVFTVAAVVAGAISGLAPLSFWKFYIFPEEQAGLWPVSPAEGKIIWGDFSDNLNRNSGLLAGYLLNIGRKPFTGRDSASRIYNIVFTPFLFLGLAGLFREKRRAVLMVFIMAMLFLIVPMASKEIQPRRILMGIYPVYLLVAVGMRFIYRLIPRRNSPARAMSVAALLLVGGWDIHEFFFQVSRPRLNYPPAALRALAAFVESNWKNVPHIRYFKEIDDSIMGNPYFVPRPERDFQVANVFAEERQDFKRTLIIYSTRVGDDLMLLYTDPPLRINRDTVAWAEEKFGRLVRRGPVSGVPGLHYLEVGLGEVAPNLVFKTGEDLKIRITGGSESGPDECKASGWHTGEEYPDLLDGESSTKVTIVPATGTEPIHIELDFGATLLAPPRSISFRVPDGGGETFFRRAEIAGSSDGFAWDRLSSIVVPSRPAGGEWLNFEFANSRSQRFYRITIQPGNWADGSGPIAISGIWIFTAPKREIKVENLI